MILMMWQCRFIIIESPRPIPMYIRNINPTFGAEGDTVNIVGEKFSTNPLDNNVTFDGIKATVLEALSYRLKVIVPQGARIGMVIVKTPRETATSNFTVTYPLNENLAITSFEPKIVRPGDTLTVNGQNFSTRKDIPNTLTVGGYSVQIIEESANQLKAVISTRDMPGKVGVFWGNYYVFAEGELTIIK